MTPIQKFLTALAAMAGIAIAATLIDSTNPDIDLPLVPDLSVGGRELPEVKPGNLVDSQTIRDELTELTSVSPFKVTLADRQYQAPDHDSLMRLVKWTQEFYWRTPELRYKPESYDCDNFARTFSVLADFAMRDFNGQVAVFRIYTHQSRQWGGVPAGGAHALIILLTSEGWHAYEPQSGQVGKLSSYPNRNHIFAITGD